MKLLTFLTSMALSLSLFSHEGHGEMPTEPAKYGGILGSVVSEVKMLAGAKDNPTIMKAEIVRSEDGTVRVYLYDVNMVQSKLEGISKDAKGILDNNKTSHSFDLRAHRDHFMGKIPKQRKKPFNIYVTFSKGAEKLFVGFDNLD